MKAIALTALVLCACTLGSNIVPKGPILSVAPMAITRTDNVGAAAQTDSVAIVNAGGGELPWKAHIQNGSGWLAIVPDSGTAPSKLLVTTSPGVLAAGTYRDLIQIQDLSTGSIQVVTVELDLQ